MEIALAYIFTFIFLFAIFSMIVWLYILFFSKRAQFTQSIKIAFSLFHLIVIVFTFYQINIRYKSILEFKEDIPIKISLPSKLYIENVLSNKDDFLKVIYNYKRKYDELEKIIRIENKAISFKQLNEIYYSLLDISLNFDKNQDLYWETKWSLLSLIFQLDLLNYATLNPNKKLYSKENHYKILDYKLLLFNENMKEIQNL